MTVDANALLQDYEDTLATLETCRKTFRRLVRHKRMVAEALDAATRPGDKENTANCTEARQASNVGSGRGIEMGLGRRGVRLLSLRRSMKPKRRPTKGSASKRVPSWRELNAMDEKALVRLMKVHKLKLDGAYESMDDALTDLARQLGIARPTKATK